MRLIMAALLLTACGGAPASTPSNPTQPPAPAPTPTAAPLSNRAAPGAPGSTDRVPVGSGPLGTASPTYIKAVDAHERWVALCQARKDTDGDGKIEVHVGHHGDLYGDVMDLYLVLGGGDGTRIDAFAGQSADGRWLAIVRDAKVQLVDAQTGDVFDLRGADAQSDGRPGARHRAAMFSKNRLLYIRHTDAEDKLVVHDLADHSERELSVPGRIWRIDYDPDRVAHLYTVGRGESFPMLRTTLGKGECLGPAMSYSTYGNSGPAPKERWIDLDTGKELAAAGGRIAVGTTIVRTPDDGSLYFDGDQIAPPSCRAQLLAVMPQPVRAIAVCGEKAQAKVLLLGKGLRKELAAINREDESFRELSGPTSPAVVCGAYRFCVATATSQPLDLKGGRVEHVWGSKVYASRPGKPDSTFELIDVATGARTPIPTVATRWESDRYVLDHRFDILDMETGKVLGRVPDALRVSAKGRALVPAAEDTGPLRWTAP